MLASLGFLVVLAISTAGFRSSHAMPIGTTAPSVAKVASSGPPGAVEIEIPLKIRTQEDLVSWVSYAMRLMASKINITLTSESRGELSDISIEKKRYVNDNRPSSTAPTIFERERKVVTEEDSAATSRVETKGKGATGMSRTSMEEGSSRSSELDFADDSDGNAYFRSLNEPKTSSDSTENQIFKNPEIFAFGLNSENLFPLPLKDTKSPPYPDEIKPENDLRKSDRQPIRTSKDKDPPLAAVDVEEDNKREKLEKILLSLVSIDNITIQNDRRAALPKPIISVPFEAVITIGKDVLANVRNGVQGKLITIPTRDPPDEFPPYFEKNFSTIPDIGAIRVTDQKEFDGDDEKASMKKRQTSSLTELLRMLGFVRRSQKPSEEIAITPVSLVKAFKTGGASKMSSARLERVPSRGRRNETSGKQELEEDEGSLGSITDLIPLVIPILEDVSNPNSDTDLGELLQVGLPLLQGLSEGDGEDGPLDIPATLAPIIAGLSRGRDGQGIDSGAIFQAIIPLAAPLIGPLIGPLVGPLLQSSSNPNAPSGSTFGTLVTSLLGPLSQPTETGGISPLSGLISGIVAGLSRDLTAGGPGAPDLGSLVASLVSGVLAGTSAGLSGGSSAPQKVHQKPARKSVASPTGYGNHGAGPVPAASVDSFELIGTSFKDIVGAVFQLSKSVLNSATGILGASSQEKARPTYGPAY